MYNVPMYDVPGNKRKGEIYQIDNNQLDKVPSIEIFFGPPLRPLYYQCFIVVSVKYLNRLALITAIYMWNVVE